MNKQIQNCTQSVAGLFFLYARLTAVSGDMYSTQHYVLFVKSLVLRLSLGLDLGHETLILGI